MDRFFTNVFSIRSAAVLAVIALAFFAQTGVSAQNRQLEQENNNTQKRIALVIGNGAYTKAKALPNPANDAADMAQALKDLGFEVLSGTNLNKRQMENLIREFGAKLANGGTGLFYYAGHGIQVGGENYLVPVEADIPEEDEVAYSAVPVSLVLTKMTTAKNDLNIVILDACRNNPFARSWRSFRDNSNSDGLAKISPPTGTLVLYATEPGKVASDGAGRNGLFTEALLKQIKKPNVEYDQMVKAISADVWRNSNKQQLPWKEGNTLQDFYFVGKGENVVNNTIRADKSNETVAETKGGEAAFWRTIENSDDLADFENYLSRSNSGEFTGTYKSSAELKIAQIKKAKNVAVWSNLSGMARILLKYDDVRLFSEGLAAVRGSSKSGFIDKTGTEIIPLKYDFAFSFSEGLASVLIGGWKNGKWGFIDKTGKEIIPLKYIYAFSFAEDLAVVRIADDKRVFIDKTGREVIPTKYYYATVFSEGLAPVRIGGNKANKYGYIDKTGKEVIPLKYDDVGLFSEGLAPVQFGGNKKDKWGFIDKTDREIIPAKYDEAAPFSEGLAWVRIGDKQAFIDKMGREIISLKYNYVASFSQGLALVLSGSWKKGKWGYIDKTGKEVISVKYDNVWCDAFIKEGFIGVVLNDKKGFVDIYGNEYFDF
jgi:hypothetical protein